MVVLVHEQRRFNCRNKCHFMESHEKELQCEICRNFCPMVQPVRIFHHLSVTNHIQMYLVYIPVQKSRFVFLAIYCTLLSLCMFLFIDADRAFGTNRCECEYQNEERKRNRGKSDDHNDLRLFFLFFSSNILASFASVVLFSCHSL